MTSTAYQETCFSAVANLDEALQEALPNNTYFVVGGIATAAYRHQNTVLNPETGVALVPADADMSVYRPNGTLRDVDILVNDVLDPKRAHQARRAAERAVNGNLEVSLFGFDQYETSISRRFEPLSHRLQNRAGECFYKMGAVVRQVPAETYQNPWQLALPNGSSVQTLHPIAHALAYEVRSVGGLRGKDREKHTAMAQNITEKLGEAALKDAARQFASWQQFATALSDVRAGRYGAVSEDTRRPQASALELRVMRAQGRALGALERQERLVSMAQNPRIQRLLQVVIGNA